MNRRGMTLLELVVAMGISGILMLALVSTMGYGVSVWSGLRREANAINYANDIIEEMQYMAQSAYSVAICKESNVYYAGENANNAGENANNIDPQWGEWDSIKKRYEWAIYLVDMNQIDNDDRGRVCYMQYDAKNNTYSDRYYIPSRYSKGLYVTNLNFSSRWNTSPVKKWNTSPLENENDSSTKRDYFYEREDILVVEFTIVTSAVYDVADYPECADYDGHKPLYHASYSFLIYNLASNYNMAVDMVTKEAVNYNAVSINHLPAQNAESTYTYHTLLFSSVPAYTSAGS